MKYLGMIGVLLLILCALGCISAGTNERDDTSPPATTEVATTAMPASVPTEAELTEPPTPELLYLTTTTYDPETRIQRTTLDPQGYDLSIFFEIPVFGEEIAACREINAFLEQLRDDFFSPEKAQADDNITSAWTSVVHKTPEDQSAYYYEHKAVINTETDALVSVSIRYNWWIGGVNDYGSESYTFSAATGQLLKLADLVSESDGQIKAAMVNALKAEGAAGLEEIQVDEFEFAVRGSEIWLLFDKYQDAVIGSELYLPLSITYGGPEAFIERPSPWQDDYARLLRETDGVAFSLCDVNQDGIPELVVERALPYPDKYAYFDIYTYEENAIHHLGEVGTLDWSHLWLDGQGGILGYAYGAGGGCIYRWYLADGELCGDGEVWGYHYPDGEYTEWFRGPDESKTVRTEETEDDYQTLWGAMVELEAYDRTEENIADYIESYHF